MTTVQLPAFSSLELRAALDKARKTLCCQRGAGSEQDGIGRAEAALARWARRMHWPDVDPGRRRNMQANKGKDTKPELTVRRLLHSLGYRFRLHRRDLPGKPDIIFPARRKVIEVRGCFWHGHNCFPLGQLPRSRTDYWGPKIAGNRDRDARNLAALQAAGWEVLEIWECRVRAAPDSIRLDLVSFLGPPGPLLRIQARWHHANIA